MSEMVEVPRWALDFVMENAGFEDHGPRNSPWRSDEMERAVKVLVATLKQEPVT